MQMDGAVKFWCFYAQNLTTLLKVNPATGLKLWAHPLSQANVFSLGLVDRHVAKPAGMSDAKTKAAAFLAVTLQRACHNSFIELGSLRTVLEGYAG